MFQRNYKVLVMSCGLCYFVAVYAIYKVSIIPRAVAYKYLSNHLGIVTVKHKVLVN